jgi:ribosomal protein S18 acetylase RimI-like enzyme
MSNVQAISVRRLTAGEGETYRKIRLEALKTAPSAFSSSYGAECGKPLKHFENRVSNGCVFGAFQGNDIIGVSGFYQQSGSKLDHKGVLWGMYVSPKARNLSAGRKLVQAVIEHAQDFVDLITLTVATENEAAVALYTTMGFQVFGTEARALKIGTEYLSETFMIRDLK